MSPPRPQKERSPDLVEQEGASGIEKLPERVARYGQAKKKALDLAEFIGTQEGGKGLAKKVTGCGDYLLFRHYFTVDQVRLHAAYLCKKHLLCPVCAIRRGSKALQAYLPRYEALRLAQPLLRPFLVTLTVKDGPDLEERFQHLQNAQHELWKRRHRLALSSLDDVQAAVWSYEVKRGSGSGQWHPHLHMVAMATDAPDAFELACEWKSITGDSHVVDVRPIDTSDPASGFCEVFKYALKFSDMSHADTWAAFQVLQRRRLVGSSGLFRGIEIPEQLLDEPLDDLPFVELLFRYLGKGYSLQVGHRPAVARGRPPSPDLEMASAPKETAASQPHQDGSGSTDGSDETDPPREMPSATLQPPLAPSKAVFSHAMIRSAVRQTDRPQP